MIETTDVNIKMGDQDINTKNYEQFTLSNNDNHLSCINLLPNFAFIKQGKTINPISFLQFKNIKSIKDSKVKFLLDINSDQDLSINAKSINNEQRGIIINNNIFLIKEIMENKDGQYTKLIENNLYFKIDYTSHEEIENHKTPLNLLIEYQFIKNVDLSQFINFFKQIKDQYSYDKKTKHKYFINITYDHNDKPYFQDKIHKEQIDNKMNDNFILYLSLLEEKIEKNNYILRYDDNAIKGIDNIIYFLESQTQLKSQVPLESQMQLKSQVPLESQITLLEKIKDIILSRYTLLAIIILALILYMKFKHEI